MRVSDTNIRRIAETNRGGTINRVHTLRRKRRVTVKEKKCAAVVCNEDEVNPVTFKWKWG